MILGDSLQVMASLAEREGLKGQVQCIYFDPPYGIKFNSNFQWSTTSRDVKDGKANHITREPEQVKAFRDTWRDGVNSYLQYLNDRLIIAKDLLSTSGSLFLQIGEENVHRARCLLDEVFREENFVSLITLKTTGGLGSSGLKSVSDYILWYCKDKDRMKFRKPLLSKMQGEGSSTGERYCEAYDTTYGTYRSLTREERKDPTLIPSTVKTFQYDNLISSGYTPSCIYTLNYQGRQFTSGGGRSWKTNQDGMNRLIRAGRIGCTGKSVRYRRYLNDYPGYEVNNIWSDNAVRTDKQYVVETSTRAIQRCLLMASDPGDLIIDPTCGSGSTATVAEQWGRRWITIDTSRVALALARARIMGSRYPYYLLADSLEGQLKEADLTHSVPSDTKPTRNLRQGFVYERVPHITLKSIANNIEIDSISEKWDSKLIPLLAQLNNLLGETFSPWDVPSDIKNSWPDQAKTIHSKWLDGNVARQKEIDASISAKAEFEYLYDKPFEDISKVRIAGPFTVESLSPHRTMIINDDDSLIDPHKKGGTAEGASDFSQIMDTLRVSGVQQAHKEDSITFESLDGWPGSYIAGKLHTVIQMEP